jgi:hypothetical protein
MPGRTVTQSPVVAIILPRGMYLRRMDRFEPASSPGHRSAPCGTAAFWHYQGSPSTVVDAPREGSAGEAPHPPPEDYYRSNRDTRRRLGGN